MGVFKRWHEHKDGTKTPYWYYRLWHNGREIKRSVGEAGIVTKTQAKRVMEETKRRLRLGKFDISDARIPTLGEFQPHFIRHQRDVALNRSWARDEYGLKHFVSKFGSKNLTHITPGDIDDYKQMRLEEVKPGTVKRELEIIRRLFNLAKRDKKCFGDNPVTESGMVRVENQVMRILSYEEEEKLLKHSPAHLKPIIMTALNTGMRKGELLTLTWDAVDFHNNIITIHAQHSKSRKTKKIPINSPLRKALLEQKLVTQGSGYVFLTPNGGPYKHQNCLKRAFHTACKNAGTKGLRFHDLRHTAATRMVESGANIVAVSRILGHADLKTTMRYVHPDDSLREAVENLGNFNTNRPENRTSEKTEEV